MTKGKEANHDNNEIRHFNFINKIKYTLKRLNYKIKHWHGNKVIFLTKKPMQFNTLIYVDNDASLSDGFVKNLIFQRDSELRKELGVSPKKQFTDRLLTGGSTHMVTAHPSAPHPPESLYLEDFSKLRRLKMPCADMCAFSLKVNK